MKKGLLLFITLIGLSSVVFGQGSTITSERTGQSTDTLCPTGLPTTVHFDSSGISQSKNNFAYLVTNQSDVVIDVLTASDNFTFPDDNIFEFHVWGVEYDGTLNASAGDQVPGDVSSGGGSPIFSSTNLIINKYDGGELVSPSANFSSEILKCLSDSSYIHFDIVNSTPSNINFQLIITDLQNDTILMASPTDSIKVNSLGEGEYNVHGVAYKGQLQGVHEDSLVSGISSTECYDLSSSLTLKLANIDGGMVSTNKFSGDTLALCKGETVGQISINKNNNASSQTSYTFIQTDKTNDTITTVLPGSSVNFSNKNIGEWHVHGVSHFGSLNVTPGDLVSEINPSGCFDLSENFLVIKKDSVHVDSIMTTSGADTVNVENNADSVIAFDSTSMATEGASFAYIVTSTNDDTVYGYFNHDQLQFNNFTPKMLHVHGLSYVGNLPGIQSGTLMDSLDLKCQNLSSNHITVIKEKGSSNTDGLVEKSKELSGLSVFPNPANKAIQVEFNSEKAMKGQIRLMNLNGRIMYTKNINTSKGPNDLKVDLSGLSSGQYILSINNGSKRIATRKVIVR